MATKTKREKAAAKVLTPVELQEAIRATLAHWFPHCEHAALAFLPGPGMPPLELWVAGDVFYKAGVGDMWYTGNHMSNSYQGAGQWNPPDEDDAD